MVRLGHHIRKLRQMNNLTQEQLAELADLNITFLGHIERGSKNPTIETLNKLSKALHVSLPELVSFEANPCDPTPPPDKTADSELEQLLIEYTAKIKQLYK